MFKSKRVKELEKRVAILENQKPVVEMDGRQIGQVVLESLKREEATKKRY